MNAARSVPKTIPRSYKINSLTFSDLLKLSRGTTRLRNGEIQVNLVSICSKNLLLKVIDFLLNNLMVEMVFVKKVLLLSKSFRVVLHSVAESSYFILQAFS